MSRLANGMPSFNSQSVRAEPPAHDFYNPADRQGTSSRPKPPFPWLCLMQIVLSFVAAGVIDDGGSSGGEVIALLAVVAMPLFYSMFKIIFWADDRWPRKDEA